MTVERPTTDRPNTVPWPPVIYALTAVAVVALEWAWPLAAPYAVPPVRAFGTMLIVLGVVCAVLGLRRFRALGTPVDPTARAEVLAQDGIYGRTRNPMYLGALIVLLGVGLAVPSSWALILLLPMAIGLTKLAIEREEAFLTRRFGADYVAYTQRVRRWW